MQKGNNMLELVIMFIRERMEMLEATTPDVMHALYNGDRSRYLVMQKRFLEVIPMVGAWVWTVSCGKVEPNKTGDFVDMHHRNDSRVLCWYADAIGLERAAKAFALRLERMDWEMAFDYGEEKSMTPEQFIEKAKAGFNEKSMEILAANQREHPGQYNFIKFVEPVPPSSVMTRAETMKKQIIKPMTVSAISKILDLRPADVLPVAAGCVDDGRSIKYASKLSVKEAHTLIDLIVSD